LANSLARQNFIVRTGAAYGTDAAVMKGVNSVNPELLDLYLPWDNYNSELWKPGNKITVFKYDSEEHLSWLESVIKYHPYLKKKYKNIDALKDTIKSGSYGCGEILLHARNYGIIVGKEPAASVFAWPNKDKTGMGGTGQGIRIAKANNISLFDLSNKEIRDIVYKEFIKSSQ
jgi:hypothetical protein